MVAHVRGIVLVLLLALVLEALEENAERRTPNAER
jgi:hypothetical protein